MLDRTVRLAARITPAGVFAVPSRDAPRRGRESIAIRLLAHDGSIVEVAAAETERTELVGPFLGAALSDLPQPPVRRREP